MDWTTIISTLLASLIPTGGLLAIVTDEYKTQWKLEHPVEILDNFEEEASKQIYNEQITEQI